MASEARQPEDRKGRFDLQKMLEELKDEPTQKKHKNVNQDDISAMFKNRKARPQK